MGPEAHADALDSKSLASGDVDVFNTKAQPILPCLETVTIHAMIAEEPIALVPDFPTLATLAPDLFISLGNCWFDRKDAPVDVREEIIVVSPEVIASDRVQKLVRSFTGWRPMPPPPGSRATSP